MRIVRGCLLVAAAVVVLVVTSHIVRNVVLEVRADRLRSRMRVEASERLTEQLPAAREQQAVVAARFGPPDHSWTEQVCERDTDDAGWMVESNRETCVLRVASLWRVTSWEEAVSMSPPQDRNPPPSERNCQLMSRTADGTEAYFVQMGADEPYCLTQPLAGRRGVSGERVIPAEGTWLYVHHDSPLVDQRIGCVHWKFIFCEDPWGESHAFGETPAS